MNFWRSKMEGKAESAHDMAATWRLRLDARGLSAKEQSQFDRWLNSDPGHDKAWADIALALKTVDRNAANADLMDMRKTALATRPEFHGRWYLSAAAGLLIAILGSSAFLLLQPPVSDAPISVPAELAVPAPMALLQEITQPAPPANAESASYRTAIGERETVRLPDGSIATLDTNTSIKIAYSGKERGVRLVQGQALFEVAKLKGIPFRVYAGNRRITAVGTKFNVRLDGMGAGTAVNVALLEGVVKVATVNPPDAAPVETVTLAAGEVLEARGSMPTLVSSADTNRVTSWQAGILTFDDAALGDAVVEMNRYTSRPIRLADAKLGALRISGVFRTGDPERFAQTIAAALHLDVIHSASGASELRPQE